jgi:hypothetical protein
MTGAIQNWFSKAKQPPTGMGSGMPGASGMPGMSGMGMPADASMGGMGGMATPNDASMGGMGGMATPADPSMGGMPAPADGMSAMPGMDPSSAAAASAMPSTAPQIYAGIAFEVHALTAGGQTVPVDPNTHVFASGERFVVLYRPSLPGQVAIYNVNPLGQEKQIDAVNVAAGELTRLGPYEFRDNVGREVMRLILTPCRNAQLLATTRDIVKVSELPAAGASTALGLPECSTVATRDVRPQTRDIVKVSAEQGTMFALDPVSQQELQSGSVVPRELTLTFNHH